MIQAPLSHSCRALILMPPCRQAKMLCTHAGPGCCLVAKQEHSGLRVTNIAAVSDPEYSHTAPTSVGCHALPWWSTPGISNHPSMLCILKGCKSQVLYTFGHSQNGFGLISGFLLIGAWRPCPGMHCGSLWSSKPRGQHVLAPTRE